MDIEKRLHPRINVDIRCEIIFKDKIYDSLIHNVSMGGLYIESTPDLIGYPAGLSSNDNIQVTCVLPSGDNIMLKCQIKWILIHDKQLNIGVELIESPSAFFDFVKEMELT
ncbi:MAG: PilZ domain-containing protein [Thermodesulfovibrionia bacterium]|nr:PilZ domain-containing protein [Thermodesulfovibrionia bacterium]